MGALPIAGLLGWHKFFTERTDKRQETIAELRDRVRSTMDVQSLAMYDRLEEENKRLTKRLAEIEVDRNRGWDLVRWWNADCHRMKHMFSNVAQVANGRLERIGFLAVEIEEQGGGQITQRQLADLLRVARTVDIPPMKLPEIEEPIPAHTYQPSEVRHSDGSTD